MDVQHEIWKMWQIRRQSINGTVNEKMDELQRLVLKLYQNVNELLIVELLCLRWCRKIILRTGNVVQIWHSRVYINVLMDKNVIQNIQDV